ncbi:MAG: phenylalanine--tRNA ligase subunit beta [Deltaproteobacteria bacterium]|nr:phenylalanine--tRNA ligase subunit beta [Deltaproteobacteria bacterium]
MLASISWLGDYLDVSDLAPEFVADKLTMVGLEVEELRNRLSYLDKVVVATVAQASPFGEHLLALTVQAGQFGEKKIICGDPKVEVGGRYPLALVGCELPGGIVKEKTIGSHGSSGSNGSNEPSGPSGSKSSSPLISEGMLCSESELGLGSEAGFVMNLSGPAADGTTLADYLRAQGVDAEDYVLEVSVTPNRADALCLVGLARDLGAVLSRRLIEPKFSVSESERSAFEQITVSIDDPNHCYRYAGRVINGARPGPSPDWMVKRLLSAGLRSINNIVDVTNYVMLELGLPLHAFDLKKIAGPAIIVKMYKQGEKFTTLDGQERTLKAHQNIMICDAQRPIGLAGVMGGLNTEVDDSTTDVFLEAACFNPTTIRKTSRSLGLLTDASFRFERGQDPNGCPMAVDRAAAMIAELTGGKVAKGRLDAYPKLIEPKQVAFSPERCNALLGTKHSAGDMERVLSAIGVALKKNHDETYQAWLPTFRPDLAREVDLFEEVVRLIDFENLPATLPRPIDPISPPPRAFELRELIRKTLSAFGYSEIVSYSFINQDALVKMNIEPTHPWRSSVVKILNPLSEDHGILRPSLLPGLLAAVRLNQYHSQWNAALFEVGAVFTANPNDPKPLEAQTLAGALSGSFGDGSWCNPNRAADFWDIKGVVERLSDRLRLNLTYSPFSSEVPGFYDASQACEVFSGERVLGHIGLLNQDVSKALGLKEAGGKVFLFELDIDDLPKLQPAPFQGWSSYPGAARDMALVVDQSVQAGQIIEVLKESDQWPLVDVAIFDLYQGDKVPQGKKSLALRLFFQDWDRTLTDELVNGYFQGILETLSSRFSAQLRS